MLICLQQLFELFSFGFSDNMLQHYYYMINKSYTHLVNLHTTTGPQHLVVHLLKLKLKLRQEKVKT